MSRHLQTRQHSARAVDMARAKVNPGLAIDAELLKRIEKWREAQDVPVTKTAVFETALREFLEKRDHKKR